MQELTDDNILEFIKTGKVILDVYADGCADCAKYAPIFEAAEGKFEGTFAKYKLPFATAGQNPFFKTYMIAQGQDKVSAPATFVFQDGVQVSRNFGPLTEAQLAGLLDTGKVDNTALYAEKGQLISQIESNNIRIQQINRQLGIM